MASHRRSERGHTRWRRFTAILLPSLALVALLVVLTAQSLLAVSFSISGTPFVVTAKVLKGRGFEQFGVLDRSVLKVLPGHTNQIILTANAIRVANLTDLCQSVTVGGLSLRITAGDAGTPVHATNLVVDADRPATLPSRPRRSPSGIFASTPMRRQQGRLPCLIYTWGSAVPASDNRP